MDGAWIFLGLLNNQNLFDVLIGILASSINPQIIVRCDYKLASITSAHS